MVAEPAPNRPELPILFRDEALLVVNKPAGLVVHRGWATDDVTALDLARALAGRWVYPMHRLDRSTSGVLVFALSPEIARVVEQSFSHQRVEKRYLALVRGLAPERASVDHPIAKEKGEPKLAALTHVERLEHHALLNEETGVTRSYSWVLARPVTGRPHQIRRHLKHINHPIIGDVRYGKSEHNRLFRRRFGLERMVLHAEQLRLPHPLDGQLLELNAPLPAELAALQVALREGDAAASPDGTKP